MRTWIVTTAALATMALTPSTVVAQRDSTGITQDARAEVLVLGVYHMSNPGNDVFNTEADDVLSGTRQDEMQEVVAALATFRPTKIAVESGFNSDRVAQAYASYLAGEYELTRNEIDQLGFRLARRLGHKTVYPVDVGGDFPYPRVAKFAEATGRMAEFEAMRQETGARVEAQSEFLDTHTILETLLYMNAPERSAAGVGSYYRLAELGEPWDWAGADLIADWFRRNMRIYTNIVGLVESPNERILVIYGSGHLGWLQDAFAANPRFRLRELAEFAE